eukprot:GHVS01067735.1.p1 GENE.GHVS01067735.1~~GHVS01067735.1.p1  ORF type:complete len:1118 (+),score=141.61 GHVS01067735.1:80-3433(+)
MRHMLSFTSTDLLIGLSALVLLIAIYDGFEFAQIPENSPGQSVSLAIAVAESALFPLLLTIYCVLQVAKLPLLEYILLALAVFATAICPTYVGQVPQVPVWFLTTALAAFLPTAYPLYLLLCFCATSFFGGCLTLILGTSKTFFSSSFVVLVSYFIPISLVGLASYYRTYCLAATFLSAELAPTNVWALLPYIGRMERDTLFALWETFQDEEEQEEDNSYHHRRAPTSHNYDKHSQLVADMSRKKVSSIRNGFSVARTIGCSSSPHLRTSSSTRRGLVDKCTVNADTRTHSRCSATSTVPPHVMHTDSVVALPPSFSSITSAFSHKQRSQRDLYRSALEPLVSLCQHKPTVVAPEQLAENTTTTPASPPALASPPRAHSNDRFFLEPTNGCSTPIIQSSTSICSPSTSPDFSTLTHHLAMVLPHEPTATTPTTATSPPVYLSAPSPSSSAFIRLDSLSQHPSRATSCYSDYSDVLRPPLVRRHRLSASDDAVGRATSGCRFGRLGNGGTSLGSFDELAREESAAGLSNPGRSLILPSETKSVIYLSSSSSSFQPQSGDLSSSAHREMSFTMQQRMVVELRRIVVSEIKLTIRSHRRHGVIGVLVGKRTSGMAGRKSSRGGHKFSDSCGGFAGAFGAEEAVCTGWMDHICGGGGRYLTKKGSLCRGMVEPLLGKKHRTDGRQGRRLRDRTEGGLNAAKVCDADEPQLRRRRGGGGDIGMDQPGGRSDTPISRPFEMDGVSASDAFTRGMSGVQSSMSVDAAVITIASPPPPAVPASTSTFVSFHIFVRRCFRYFPRCPRCRCSPLWLLRFFVYLPRRIATSVHNARVLMNLASINKPLFDSIESHAADSSRTISNSDQVNRWLLDWLRGVTSLEYAPFLCWWQLTAMLINTVLTVSAQWWVGLYITVPVNLGEGYGVDPSKGLSDTFFLYRVIIASAVDVLLVLPQFFTLGVSDIHVFNIFSYSSVLLRCLCTLIDFSFRTLYNVQDDLSSFGSTLTNLASAPVLTRLSTKLFRLLFGLLFVLQNILFLACASMSSDGVSARDAALWGRMTISYISIYLLMCGFFSRGEELAHRVRFSLFVLPYLVQLHDTTHNMQDKDEPDTISGHGQFYSAINGGL